MGRFIAQSPQSNWTHTPPEPHAGSRMAGFSFRRAYSTATRSQSGGETIQSGGQELGFGRGPGRSVFAGAADLDSFKRFIRAIWLASGARQICITRWNSPTLLTGV